MIRAFLYKATVTSASMNLRVTPLLASTLTCKNMTNTANPHVRMFAYAKPIERKSEDGFKVNKPGRTKFEEEKPVASRTSLTGSSQFHDAQQRALRRQAEISREQGVPMEYLQERAKRWANAPTEVHDMFEEHYQKALNRGDFDPKANSLFGKPIPRVDHVSRGGSASGDVLEDYCNRQLAESGFKPDYMELITAADERLVKARSAMKSAAQHRAAGTITDAAFSHEESVFRKALRTYNQDVSKYNLMLPPQLVSVCPRFVVNVDNEMADILNQTVTMECKE